jgi:HTH-type transcriptional regulator / antitoxin HigA
MKNPISARPTPPGATLRRILEEKKMTQRQFAEVIERPEQFVSDLIKGKRQLTPDTAHRLAAAFDMSAEFWLRREANYRLRVEEPDRNVIERIKERAHVV